MLNYSSVLTTVSTDLSVLHQQVKNKHTTKQITALLSSLGHTTGHNTVRGWIDKGVWEIHVGAGLELPEN